MTELAVDGPALTLRRDGPSGRQLWDAKVIAGDARVYGALGDTPEAALWNLCRRLAREVRE